MKWPTEIETTEEQTSTLEAEIVRLIDHALKERLIEIGLEDVKVIVKELMPDIDRMISEKVKVHFRDIGLYMVEKFSDIGE
jgi:hypothetical protein